MLCQRGGDGILVVSRRALSLSSSDRNSDGIGLSRPQTGYITHQLIRGLLQRELHAGGLTHGLLLARGARVATSGGGAGEQGSGGSAHEGHCERVLRDQASATSASLSGFIASESCGGREVSGARKSVGVVPITP